MKFGTTLERAVHPPWAEHYVDYRRLKALLRDDDDVKPAPATPQQQRHETWTAEDEGAFAHELLNVQLDKVYGFHTKTLEALQDRMARCEEQLAPVAAEKQEKKGDPDGDDAATAAVDEAERQRIFAQVKPELDEIARQTNELSHYARINYTGFLKACKKHDRKRGSDYSLRPMLNVQLALKPFHKADYSSLLYRLGAVHSFLRQHAMGSDKQAGAATDPHDSPAGRDEYVSHKFWVHPENLLEVKTVILRRLPVLVYNPQPGVEAEGSAPDPSITSIYFDNSQLALYTKKVEQTQGDRPSLRLRWYGRLASTPTIWVERKTMRDDDVAHEARVALKEKHVHDFLRGEYHLEKTIRKMEEREATNGGGAIAAPALREDVADIQALIRRLELQPVLRARYTRMAFQIPGDDRARISLDTDLAFVREDALDTVRPCRDPDAWHRADIDGETTAGGSRGGNGGDPFAAVRKGEVGRFPFAVLEIKLRHASRRPEWIEELMHSHLVQAAPRFSKFVHGVAQLFDDYVNTFPSWLPEIDTDIRRDPRQAFEEEQAQKQKARDEESAVGSFLKASASSRPHAPASHLISPVGSPDVPASSPRRESHIDDAVPSLDETVNAHARNALPGLSTSKYAQARRGRPRLPSGVEEPRFWLKDQGEVRVEPKVWLANQRTFIKWQHISVLLASLSLGLYNAAGPGNPVARALAVAYTAVAAAAGVWGYFVYMWRQRMIAQRSGRDLDAVAGPVVVCVGLAAALVLNFWFQVSGALGAEDALLFAGLPDADSPGAVTAPVERHGSGGTRCRKRNIPSGNATVRPRERAVTAACMTPVAPDVDGRWVTTHTNYRTHPLAVIST